MFKDPLNYLYEKYGCEISEIKSIHLGERFISVCLNNNQMGVCARQEGNLNESIDQFQNINLKNFAQRSLLTAYYTAKLNYSIDVAFDADIIDDIVNGDYKSTVMIGYFSSLVKKLKAKNQKISVFDLQVTNEHITPMEDQGKYLTEADSIILTATSILNMTFKNILEQANSSADIYLVGPSSVLCFEFLEMYNINKIHGARFNGIDQNVIEAIKRGAIPKEFLKFGEKVSIQQINQ